MNGVTASEVFPESWEKRALGTVAETQLGKMLNSSKQTGSSAMPYLRNFNLKWGRIDLSDVKEMDIFAEEKAQFTLKRGDVLVCEGGEPGRAAVWDLDIEMGFQNAIHRIRPSERLSSEFLRFQFEWLVKNGFLDENFSGVTIKHFSQQKLRKLPVVIPPLSEQQRIVEILEEQLSRLDGAVKSVQTVREKAAQFRRSLLHAAFLGSDETKWRNVPLEDVLEFSIGGVWGEGPGESEVDVEVVRVTELRSHGVVDISTAVRRSITQKQLESRALKPGDLVLEKSGGGPNTPVGRVGKIIRTEHPTVCSNFMQLMRPDLKTIRPSFLHHFLVFFHSDGKTIPLQTATTNIRNIKTKDYLKTPIPVPSLDEQDGIIQFLEEQLSHLDSTLAVANEVERKANALRRSLLHAAFTGELTRSWRESHV